MAVKLRLMRMGKKKQPTYRIVAADSRSPRNGRFIEIIGHYDARREPSVIKVDNDRAVHWLRHGAQPSETVGKLLTLSGAVAVAKGDPLPEGAEAFQKVVGEAEATPSAPAPKASAVTAPTIKPRKAPEPEAPADDAAPDAAEASADADAPAADDAPVAEAPAEAAAEASGDADDADDAS